VSLDDPLALPIALVKVANNLGGQVGDRLAHEDGEVLGLLQAGQMLGLVKLVLEGVGGRFEVAGREAVGLTQSGDEGVIGVGSVSRDGGNAVTGKVSLDEVTHAFPVVFLRSDSPVLNGGFTVGGPDHFEGPAPEGLQGGLAADLVYVFSEIAEPVGDVSLTPVAEELFKAVEAGVYGFEVGGNAASKFLTRGDSSRTPFLSCACTWGSSR